MKCEPKTTTTTTHVGELLEQPAHGPVVVEPYPQLDAQRTLSCMLSRDNFAHSRPRNSCSSEPSSWCGCSGVVHSHGESVVRPLDNALFQVEEYVEGRGRRRQKGQRRCTVSYTSKRTGARATSARCHMTHDTSVGASWTWSDSLQLEIFFLSKLLELGTRRDFGAPKGLTQGTKATASGWTRSFFFVYSLSDLSKRPTFLSGYQVWRNIELVTFNLKDLFMSVFKRTGTKSEIGVPLW